MSVFYITFRSVTPAQRGESLLRKHGFRCSIQRTPRWMQENGCGYCLRLVTDRVGEAVEILDGGNLAYRKVYRLDGKGNAEEMLE